KVVAGERVAVREQVAHLEGRRVRLHVVEAIVLVVGPTQRRERRFDAVVGQGQDRRRLDGGRLEGIDAAWRFATLQFGRRRVERYRPPGLFFLPVFGCPRVAVALL